MSLIAMLEASKQVAMDTREAVKRRNVEEVAEFEEYGADLAAALDAQELAASEEALKLAQEFDDKEEEEVSERERADLELARSILQADESIEAACQKDHLLAQQVETMLRKDTVRVAKLEKREQQLKELKDVALAEQLASEILEEEQKLALREAADRKLAAELVKDEFNVLKGLPQTEEKLRALATNINGNAPVPLRSRLRNKLASMRKGLERSVQHDKENGVVH